MINSLLKSEHGDFLEHIQQFFIGVSQSFFLWIVRRTVHVKRAW
jgi:hypothetical protein